MKRFTAALGQDERIWGADLNVNGDNLRISWVMVRVSIRVRVVRWISCPKSFVKNLCTLLRVFCSVSCSVRSNGNVITLCPDIAFRRNLCFRSTGILLCSNGTAMMNVWTLDEEYNGKFHINQKINRPDIAEKRFSLWWPSAMLNLQNYSTLSCDSPWKRNLWLHTKLLWNRMIPGSVTRGVQKVLQLGMIM